MANAPEPRNPPPAGLQPGDGGPSSRALLDALGEAVLVATPDGHILHANPAAASLLQVELDELVTRTLDNVICGGYERAASALQHGMTEWEGDAATPGADGSPMPITLRLTRVREGDATYLIVALHRSPARTTIEPVDALSLIAASAYPALALTASRRIVAWNSAAERLLGYSAREMLGRDISRIVSPDRMESVDLLTAYLHLRGPAYEVAAQVVRKDGGRLEVLLHCSRLRGTDGAAVGVAIGVRMGNDGDAEDGGTLGEARFRAMFGRAAVGMALVDGRGRVVESNAALARTLGYDPAELQGVSIASLTHPDDREASRQLVGELARGTRVHDRVEKRYLRKDGSVVFARLTVTLVPHGVAPTGDGSDGTGLIGLAMVEDVTARRDAEDALRAIFDNPAVSFALVDRRGIVRAFNPLALDRVTGATDRDLQVGMSIADFVASEERSVLQVAGARVLAGETFRWEDRLHTAAGPRWIELIAYPVQLAGGEAGACIMSLDITARKEAEEERERVRADALAAEERARDERVELLGRMRGILESTTDAFWTLDRDWRFTYLNPRAEALLGRDASYLVGRVIWEEFPEAVDKPFGIAYRRAMATGEPAILEAYSDPSHRWFDVRAYPSDGGLAVYLHDVTGRKEAEEALAASEHTYRALMEQATDAIVMADLDGRILRANRVTSEMLGYTDDELVTMRLEELVPPEHLVAFPFRYRQLALGQVMLGERVLRRKDGSTLPADVSSKLLDDGRVFVIARDATPRLQAEAERVRAAETAAEAAAAIQADQLKTDLLNTVSHELRTPLGAITGFSSMLLSYDDRISPDERLDYLREIAAASERLGLLVDDLLQLGQLQSGALQIERLPLKLEDVLGEEVAGAGRRHDDRRIALTIEEDLPGIRGDRRRLGQVAGNLLANAVKFSPEGGVVTVRAWTEPHDARDAAGTDTVAEGGAGEDGGADTTISWAAFSVTDLGIGIAPEEQGRVFERFFRAGTGRAREIGGTGLGLAICREIVEAHGGTISLASTPGHGTTVTVRLPVV